MEKHHEEQIEANRVLRIDVQQMFDIENWLNNCPLEDAQPILETVAPIQERIKKRITENAEIVSPGWNPLNDETLFDPYEEDIECWKAFLERLDT